MEEMRNPEDFSEVSFFISESLHLRMRNLCRPPDKPESRMVVTEALRIGMATLRLIQNARFITENNLSPEEFLINDFVGNPELTLEYISNMGNQLDEMIEIEKSITELSGQRPIVIFMPSLMELDLEQLTRERNHDSIDGLMVDAALAFCLTEEFRGPDQPPHEEA